MSLYLSYIRAYKKFAHLHLNKSTSQLHIGKYANTLTAKANELLARAALNKNINIRELEKELFYSGGSYVRKYSNKFRKPVSKAEFKCY